MVARPVHQLIGKRNEGAWEAHSDLTSHLGHVQTKSLLSDGRSLRKMGNKSLPGVLGGLCQPAGSEQRLPGAQQAVWAPW